eukprot:gene375-6789_t
MKILVKNALKLAKEASESCGICLSLNEGVHPKTLKEDGIKAEPLRQLALDFFEVGIKDSTAKFCLNLTCLFTGFTIVKGMKRKTLGNQLQMILEILPFSGQLLILGGDQAFKPLQEALEALDINIKISIAYDHETSSKIERSNKTARNTILKVAKSLNLEKDWEMITPLAMININIQNNSFKKCFGKSWLSSEAPEKEINWEKEEKKLSNYWTKFRSFLDKLKKKIRLNMKRNEKIPKVPLEILGEKGNDRYLGPFVISEVLEDNQFKLSNGKYYFHSNSKSLKLNVSDKLTALYAGDDVPVTKYYETATERVNKLLENREIGNTNPKDGIYKDLEEVKETIVDLDSESEKEEDPIDTQESNQQTPKRKVKTIKHFHDEFGY